MISTKFFIGVDVSKPYFDVSLMGVINHVKQPIETARFDNIFMGIAKYAFKVPRKKYIVSNFIV